MAQVDESRELKPYNRSQQKIPDKILDLILGKDKTVDPNSRTKTGKARQIQKKSVVKKGRKDPGPKNPRGARTGRSLAEQILSDVGIHPDIVGREPVPQATTPVAGGPPRTKDDIRQQILQMILEEREGEAEE